MLDGQIGIITGASSGIGQGVARELRSSGMKLVLTARRGDRLQDLAEELGECECVAGDILDPGLPGRLMDTAINKWGRCDVLFNNAGIMHTGPIQDVDVDQLCMMVRVNCEAAVRMAYVALKYFKSVGAGHLINTSSILGTKVRPTAGVYAGTKYAIEALSEALRIELSGTDIKVTAIQPGLVTTELQDHFPVHPRDALGIQAPLVPRDIGRAVRFVLEQPAHVRIPTMMVVPGEQGM